MLTRFAAIGLVLAAVASAAAADKQTQKAFTTDAVSKDASLLSPEGQAWHPTPVLSRQALVQSLPSKNMPAPFLAADTRDRGIDKSAGSAGAGPAPEVYRLSPSGLEMRSSMEAAGGKFRLSPVGQAWKANRTTARDLKSQK